MKSPNKPKTSRNQKPQTAARQPSDDFVSVARRLECDEDKERFEKNLGKIARVKPQAAR